MQQLIRAAIAAAVITILGAAPTAARAQSLELFEARTNVVSQTGHGWQSKDGPTGRPGGEDLWVIEPMLFARLRSTATLTHEIAFESDVVSSASADAIDATTSASKYNEAGTIDVAHRWRHDRHGELVWRWGLHLEEPLHSDFMGGSYTRKLADDNFTISVSGLYAWDQYQKYGPYGDRHSVTDRSMGNGNVSVSQVLSPTTILDLAYGYTYQTGALETTWNAVPVVDGTIEREELPPTRSRHAATVRLSQHLPRTHTTVKASYRLYHDSFGLDAHTVELWGYQYLRPWLYGRLGARVHRQDGVDAYVDQVPAHWLGWRTSDSDLAPFTSQEWTFKLALLAGRAPFAWLGHGSLDATIGYYRRTNDLSIVWGSVGYTYEP